MEDEKPLDLTRDELSVIESFRLKRQTSVLVILFTDIKGFTELTERRGERYALDLLHRHDEILVGTIEEGGAGQVIKHIGDSIMAVFSEPSTAVERALRIQGAIAAFNREHPDQEGLRVRIGLHMGQVAVENQTQLDLFGRHVNRASRVESLADDGQIYLTYPVFDSARGWLRSDAGSELQWKLHGRYLLKGIEEPVAIYEVVDRGLRSPAAPKKGRRKASVLPLAAALALIVVGAGIAFGITRINRTEVWFVGWPAEKTFVDQKEELVLAGDPSSETRKSLMKLGVGTHLLRQDIHWQVKNYQEITVTRGKNYIRPKLVANFLPSLSRRLDWSPDEKRVEARETFSYLLYDKGGKRTENQAEITLSIDGTRDPGDKDLLGFSCAWQVTRNGAPLAHGTFDLAGRASSDEVHEKTTVVYEDAQHYWYLRSFASRWSTQIEVGAAYIEYKDL
jgi:class 3 adenylate cyclase